MQHIPYLINEKDNGMLNALHNIDEVKKFIELNSYSACGPDGFTGHFYQTCWDIVGIDIFEVVKEFFEVLLYPNQLYLLI